jgi:hypothetical protein
MSIYVRIIISVAIIILHFVGFLLPLTEVFIIYILLANPEWFRNYLNNFAEEQKK